MLSVFLTLQLLDCNEPCVEFTADQYHEIFNLRFHKYTTVAMSLANSAERWMNKTGNCKGKWENYTLPPAKNCYLFRN